jgi:membrane associated rhomboid family serine protease
VIPLRDDIPARRVPVVTWAIIAVNVLVFVHARVLVLFPIVFVPLFFEIPAVVFLVIWFGLQVLQAWMELGADSGGVAWWAHVGGFGAGSTRPTRCRRPAR